VTTALAAAASSTEGLMMRIALLASASLVLLAGCATTPGPRASAELAPAARAADTAYGMFLAGNAALNEGDSEKAARFLDIARAQSGEEPAVAERAFVAALMAGEIDKAATLAPDGPGASAPNRRLGRLVKTVELLAEDQGKLAEQTLTAEPVGFPHRPAATLITPWVAAAAGDVEGSLVKPQLRGNPVVDYFGQIGQAWLFERAKRYDEAETDFKAVTGGDTTNGVAVLAYGGFLERRGRRAEAVALYDESLAREPSNLAIKQARARAAGKKAPPPMPSIREGASFALIAPALMMIDSKQSQSGLEYLRLALRLDPDRNDTWVLLGDVLQDLGDVEDARAAYAHPKPDSPEYPTAQAKLAWSYQAAGDKQTALKLARAGAATGDFNARMTLADLLRANERAADAIPILTELMGEAKAPDWRLYYARGMAYDRSGNWKAAEADLYKALQLRPDAPELLNYLGYAWIDRGVRLQEALGMVQKAVAAAPRSGAIIDSLGWAYYRLGDYKKAVEKLEQAVELEAGDPEINNHLGDAYWMVGRKDEAVFQWKRVLTLKPEDDIKADAEKKLASGLGPMPAPKLAGQ
jgi:tetratricopeptide (TPR) repeat protein